MRPLIVGVNCEGGNIIEYIKKFNCHSYANVQIVMDAPFNDVLINRKSLQELKDTLKEILLLVKTNYELPVIIQFYSEDFLEQVLKDIFKDVDLPNYTLYFGCKQEDYYTPTDSKQFIFVNIGFVSIIDGSDLVKIGEVCNPIESYSITDYSYVKGFSIAERKNMFNEKKNILLNFPLQKIKIYGLHDDLVLVTPQHYKKQHVELQLLFKNCEITREQKLMTFVNERGYEVNHEEIEHVEQCIVTDYIDADDVVLELGARYGTVSCAIGKKLNNPKNQVSVEPDEKVWKVLERNRETNGCGFHILKGTISKEHLSLNPINNNGYDSISYKDETSSIPKYSIEEVEKQFGLKFNTLVADCEGCLVPFFEENPNLFSQLNKIIFEIDWPEKFDYTSIKNKLKEHNFKPLLQGSHNVWTKK